MLQRDAPTSAESRVAEAYCKFLSGIDWSDPLVLAGSREGRGEFLSNAFLSLHAGIPNYRQTHFVSEDALRRLEKREPGELVYEHLVPKSRYIQRPCEALAARGELTAAFARSLLERFWRLATITKTEDLRLHRVAMPDGWDGENVMARYDAAGIVLIPNPHHPMD